jgi:Ca-activated chloride channel family protein
MTNPSFNPDDPRLTAFVLGELDAADRAAVEQLLESSPEARAFVDDLQDTIGVLRDELSSEPAPALTDEQRAALQNAAESTERAKAVTELRQTPAHSRRGLLAGTVATVAALSIVVAVLPQFANQRSSDSTSFPLALTSEMANEESSLAQADDSGASPAEYDAVLSNRRVLKQEYAEREKYGKEPAGIELANSAPASASAGSSDGSSPFADSLHDPVADSVVGAGKVLLQPAPEKSSTDRESGAIRVAVTDQPSPGLKTDQSGPDQRSSSVSRPTPSGRRLAPQSASGAAGSAKGKQLSKDRILSSDQPAPVAPSAPVAQGQSVTMRSGLSNQTTPLTTLPASAPAIAAGRETAAAVPETASRTTGQTSERFRLESKSVSGPAPAAPLGEGRRGRGLQSAAQQAGQQVRVADVTRGTVINESLEEGEKRQQVLRGGTRLIVAEPPAFVPPPRDNLSVLSSGFGTAGNETYEPIVENEFVVPDTRDREKRLSTISVDVDTASYANMRRFLMQDRLPPANAVRIEELVNYFKYDYPQPKGDDPFSVTTEIMLCPWQPGHRLARIGLQAKTIDKSQRPPTNLVFLLDVSGSMRPANKLPLVQQAMRLLVEEMTEDDQIAIVTYASNAGLRLVSTPGSKKPEILQSIDSLTAGGSTNGEGGIKLAYDTAIRHYIQDGANRVILCTDGDFNVGVSNDNELVELIQEKAASGVFLSVFGFGMGNLKDGKLEKLADKGNGQYGYIDNLQEARRAFNEDLAGTLYTVAKDAKLQAEFNPATVGAYRLIGYENRKLAAADFTDDTKDAGEIGAGHTVTALYEIVPRQVLVDRLNSDEFRYTGTFDLLADEPKVAGFSDELFFVRLRYKQPDQETSQPVEADFAVSDIAISGKPVAAPSADFQFAAAVASFGMNLRNSQYRGTWTLANVDAAAQQLRGEDAGGRRGEFLDLVKRAMRIKGLLPTDAHPTEGRPAELPAAEARIKATIDGKYRRLLKKIEVRDDVQQYGAFNDFGFWDKSTEYKGHSDLLPGYWVYVYPHWYIWAEADAARLAKPESKPGDASAASTPNGKEKAETPDSAEKQ